MTRGVEQDVYYSHRTRAPVFARHLERALGSDSHASFDDDFRREVEDDVGSDSSLRPLERLFARRLSIVLPEEQSAFRPARGTDPGGFLLPSPSLAFPGPPAARLARHSAELGRPRGPPRPAARPPPPPASRSAARQPPRTSLPGPPPLVLGLPVGSGLGRCLTLQDTDPAGADLRRNGSPAGLPDSARAPRTSGCSATRPGHASPAAVRRGALRRGGRRRPHCCSALPPSRGGDAQLPASGGFASCARQHSDRARGDLPLERAFALLDEEDKEKVRSALRDCAITPGPADTFRSQQRLQSRLGAVGH